VFLFAFGITGVLAFPANQLPWLTNKGIGSNAEANEYYTAISAPATLSAWKTAYGFTGSNDVTAIYYNAGDLGFGREMHCRRSGADVACFVANHGYGASGPPQSSVEAAVNNQLNLPTVAMVYRNNLNGLANDVAFYVYDVAGNRLNQVALDSEGDKNVPHICLPCHGGAYNSTTNAVTGASFLPFDLPSFRYSTQSGFTAANQEVEIRQLNSMVRDTNPEPLITELIDGWYVGSGGVNNANAVLDDSFIPDTYNGNANDQALYNNVYKPYCRTCHIAQSFTLGNPGDLSAASYAVFTGFYMPHTEKTNHAFWHSDAPRYLANVQTNTLRVTKTADTNDGACNADCSLREAIVAANGNANQSIITFNITGTFSFGLSGTDELAAVGDLDILQPLIIIGNGAGNTIINGAGIDRVFQIQPGVQVIMNGLTVRGGNTTSDGGGIFNNGGNLTLNFSVIRNNSAYSGGGVANSNNGTVEINQSTLGPSNVASSGGGGAYNEGQASINNTTISGNTAIAGGGLYNFVAGDVMTVTHSTIVMNVGTNAGGGLRNFNGTLSHQNTIIAGNSSSNLADCGSNIDSVSLGYNLVGQNGSANGCPTNGPGDSVVAGNIRTVLNDSLSASNGGVAHHALLPSSPAIDAIPLGGNCALPSYDQRDTARPLDGDDNGTAGCDIGAREFVRASITTPDDLTANDGLCSLREAIVAANTGHHSGYEGGECPASPDVIDLSVAGPYNLTQGQLTVSAGVTINGGGKIIRRASGTGRIFEVLAGGILSLSRVTVRDGTTGAYNGDASSGGGIYINSGGIANIVNSAILNNFTSSWGGGINNLGTLNLANSTVAGNSANVDSGGINNRGTGNLTHVTVTNNTSNADNFGSGEGGGVASYGGAIYIKNSLIAGNFDLGTASVYPDVYDFSSPAEPGAEISGPSEQTEAMRAEAEATGVNFEEVLAGVNIISVDYNLIGIANGANNAFDQPNDLKGSVASPLNPQLGGQTGSPAYYAPIGDSPAIDHIPSANCIYISGLGNPFYVGAATVTADQKNTARPIGGNCEIGAVEVYRMVYLPVIMK
jgi:CSLREA domain-containing protein